MTRYIGLDAHSESCTIAVLGPSGKRLRHERFQTSAELLRNFIKEVPGPRHLCGTHCNPGAMPTGCASPTLNPFRPAQDR